LAQAGVVEVRSEIHPEIEPAWIIVAPDLLASAVTDAGGHFVIPDVAPGDYYLVCWHEGIQRERRVSHLTLRIPLTVAAGQGAAFEWDISDGK
jgi:hypothetical protein